MKKVICINDDWHLIVKEFFLEKFNRIPPEFGKTYTVVDEGVCECGICNTIIYQLQEYPEILNDDIPVGWDADHFADISEIDETEMVRETLKQLV